MPLSAPVSASQTTGVASLAAPLGGASPSAQATAGTADNFLMAMQACTPSDTQPAVSNDAGSWPNANGGRREPRIRQRTDGDDALNPAMAQALASQLQGLAVPSQAPSVPAPEPAQADSAGSTTLSKTGADASTLIVAQGAPGPASPPLPTDTSDPNLLPADSTGETSRSVRDVSTDQAHPAAAVRAQMATSLSPASSSPIPEKGSTAAGGAATNWQPHGTTNPTGHQGASAATQQFLALGKASEHSTAPAVIATPPVAIAFAKPQAQTSPGFSNTLREPLQNSALLDQSVASAPAELANAADATTAGTVPLSLSAMPPADGQASSQTEDDDTDGQHSAERTTEHTNSRMPGAGNDTAVSFGLGNWGSAAHLDVSTMSHRPGASHAASANDGMALLNHDRVAADSSARRLSDALRSDMSFGIHTDAFGRVDIRTSLRGDQLTSQLSMEQAHLHASTLAAHLPALEAQLSSKYNLDASVTVHHSASGFTASTGGQQSPTQQNRQQQKASSPDGSIPSSTAALNVSPALERTPQIHTSLIALDRLDVTI